MPKYKSLSLIVAILHLSVLFTAYLRSGQEKMLTAFFLILSWIPLPLACIWYGDEMGAWVGRVGLRRITRTSPGHTVRFMGWVLLVLVPILNVHNSGEGLLCGHTLENTGFTKLGQLWL